MPDSANSTVEGIASTTCVVTGGLGFIGSNLVRTLVAAGAEVRVVDELVESHGGRRDNLDAITGGVEPSVTIASIADPIVAEVLAGADIVFNVAGQVSHLASMRDPQQDLRLNTISHATFLETLRTVNPTARVVHTSTRQVYGRPIRTPVDELHPTHPTDVNGVAKLAGEHLHMVYASAHSMPITSLRLTNVYGPRQRLTSDELGFLPVFIRRAMLGEEIHVFGDGEQRRDCLHVDDVVAAMIAAVSDRAVGQVFNVGHDEHHSLREVADIVVDAAGSTAPTVYTPWPQDHARVDIGSVHTDGTKMTETLGWTPKISLTDGIDRTIDFYREHPWFLSSI